MTLAELEVFNREDYSKEFLLLWNALIGAGTSWTSLISKIINFLGKSLAYAVLLKTEGISIFSLTSSVDPFLTSI